jgi:hypothetical protein
MTPVALEHEVVVVGGGQAGLAIATRGKFSTSCSA